MQYRADIDGLRALAVLPVLFFHAGFSGFAGGFVGVDVFFVISGYLITAILLKEHEQQRYSLINFYERRVRRLFPALIFMLLVTTVTAILLLPAPELHSYAKSVIATLGFGSNWFFYLELDYFSLDAERWPLLHMWSLAVEEQFYFVFPLLLAGLYAIKRRLILPSIILGLMVSLYLMWHHQGAGNQSLAFYSVFSRAWELLVGSLLACLPALAATRTTYQKALGWAGLLGLIVSISGFGMDGPWPGLPTLLPVLSTALILRYSAPAIGVGKVLMWRPFVWIGLISYSLYLWHQPLYAFARSLTPGHPTALTFASLTILAVVLAALSYYTIEKPFRDKRQTTRNQAFAWNFGALGFIGAIALSLYLSQGWPSRHAQTVEVTPRIDNSACHTSGTDYLSPEKACIHNAKQGNPSWAVLGDSHGSELAYALSDEVGPVQHMTFSGCAPAYTFNHRGNPGCSPWLHEAVGGLMSNPHVDKVVVAFRHSLYLDKNPLDPDDVDWTTTKGEDIPSDELSLAYWRSMKHIINDLVRSGKHVYLISPIPELPMHIDTMVLPMFPWQDVPRYDLTQSLALEEYLFNTSNIRFMLEKLAASPAVTEIRVDTVLCGDTWCHAGNNDKAYYYDDNHLSSPGANKVLTAPGWPFVKRQSFPAKTTYRF